MIPARGSLLIETVGQPTQPVVVGSARLTTTGNISGFEIFKWLPFGQEASVPLESRTPASYVLAFDNTNGLATGLALAEVSGTAAATIPVIVRDDAGVSLTGPASIILPVNGHISFMLPGAYPATVAKRGTVEFQTPPGGRISVIGLRATPTGNVTTIPVLAK